MKKQIGILSFAILVILVAFAGCAKKPAVIKGKVTDENNEPLAGAAVFSVPQKYSTLTDTLGRFVIDGVEPGQYSLLARLGDDSTMINLGLIEPGQVMVTTIVIKKAPPPPPIVEKKPEPKPKPKPKPTPKKETPFIDPILKDGEKLLLLSTKEFFEKFEIESSDELVWELRKVTTSKLKFEGGRMKEGYFAGPKSDYFETAARRCIYDNKLWIYTHGPEQTPPGGREIYISIPLGLPGNADIDSLIVFYGFPRFPDGVPEGSVKFRLLGETLNGGISSLIDWQKIQHSSNGSFYKKAITTKGENRKLEYVTFEINSDGQAVWDALLIRPIVYFSVK